MTDKDLLLLLDEEYRRYNAYIAATNGSKRLHTQNLSDKQIRETREHWLELQEKLQRRLTPERRRELLQSRVEKKGVKRGPGR